MSAIRFRATATDPEEVERIIARLGRERKEALWAGYLHDAFPRAYAVELDESAERR